MFWASVMNGDEMWSAEKVWSGLREDNSENTRHNCLQSPALGCELEGSPTIPTHTGTARLFHERKSIPHSFSSIQSLTHVWTNLEWTKT